MGGAAFEFPILVPSELLEQARNQRLSFWKRLFGRKEAQNDIELKLGQVLKPLRGQLLDDFKAWQQKAIPEPWDATRTVQKAYLSLVWASSVSFYRKQTETGEETWATNIRLSGCAGTAEVSSWLIAHWMDTWFRQNRDRIEHDLLAPYGLSLGPGGPDTSLDNETFLPAGELGYALFNPGRAGPAVEPAEEEDEGPSSAFDLDDSAEQAAAENAEAVREFLHERFAEVMRDGRCRCQLCMPDFDVSQLQELPT